MQEMMTMMSAQIALIANLLLAVPPQDPSAIVAPTPTLPTRTPLAFPGYGVLPSTSTLNLTTPSTEAPPTTVSYRQSDVARFNVVRIKRGSVDDIKFSSRCGISTTPSPPPA